MASFLVKINKKRCPKNIKKLMSKIPDFPQFSIPKMTKNEVKKQIKINAKIDSGKNRKNMKSWTIGKLEKSTGNRGSLTNLGTNELDNVFKTFASS